MSDDLDLERGDEALAEKIAANQSQAKAGREQRKAASGKSTSSARKTQSSSRSRATPDEILKDRLNGAFDRIAEQLLVRGDVELSSVIHEDRDALTAGLVSLTRTVKILRMPLVMFLAFLEPLLAFGRVGRILFYRWRERAARVQAERAAMTPEQQAYANAADSQYAPVT